MDWRTVTDRACLLNVKNHRLAVMVWMQPDTVHWLAVVAYVLAAVV